MKRLLLVIFFILPSPLFSELLLFSDDGKFHGCLDCNKYDDGSVCNKYGKFGSKYEDKSIWSKYGVGSKYEDSSPFSKYGTGLKIVDRQGNFYGYFSISYGGERKMRKMLKNLWDSTGGDYTLMRDIFCS